LASLTRSALDEKVFLSRCGPAEYIEEVRTGERLRPAVMIARPANGRPPGSPGNCDRLPVTCVTGVEQATSALSRFG